jgi:hypothetical protein
VDADSFAIQPKGKGETVVRYDSLQDVRKAGMSRRAKAILIPASIAAGTLLVLCAGPYPIGFLCRKDPS